MKRLIPICLVFWTAAAALRGGPREDAVVAIMRLSEQPNYSWVATVHDDARIYDIAGRTIRGGFTRVKMPVINSVRRKLGRSVTDTQIEVIFHGNVRCVLETEDGWMRPDELPEPHELSDPEELLAAPGAPGIPGSRSLDAGLIKGVMVRRRAPSRPDPRERHYSNLQLALSHPHEELGVIVGSHTEMTVDGDVVSGTLSELGAALLLVRDGQKEITPQRAGGTFKLWLRDGMVTRYQVKLTGVLSVDSANGRRQIEVNQSTTTVLKDVGTTTLDVPEQARQKLLK